MSPSRRLWIVLAAALGAFVCRIHAEDCDADGVVDPCEDEGSDPCDGALFAFQVNGPNELSSAVPGGTASGDYCLIMVPLGVIREENTDGAQGWSLSIAADGCRIVDVTTKETIAASATDNPPGIRSSGFEKTELATDGVWEGAVSSVVLSAYLPISLPPREPSVICKLRVEAETPTETDDKLAVLAYHDGLQGTGPPVENSVMRMEMGSRPVLSSLEILVSNTPRGFLRGDAKSDGIVNITDSIFIFSSLFRGGPAPDCPDAADADDSGSIDITDGILVNLFLFLGGELPSEPGPFQCGPDPTLDTLGCAEPCQ